MNPGGVIIFDVCYGTAVLTVRPTVRFKRMEDNKIEVTRLAEPVLHTNQNRMDVNYHVFASNSVTKVMAELKETHSMRYFFKPEIELLTAQSNFRMIHAKEWIKGNPIGSNTWGACFCLKET